MRGANAADDDDDDDDAPFDPTTPFIMKVLACARAIAACAIAASARC